MAPTPMMSMGGGAGGNRNALNKPFNATGKRDWSFGFFDCFSACGTCMFGWCCPCLQFGKNVSRLEHLTKHGQVHPSDGDMVSLPDQLPWYLCDRVLTNATLDVVQYGLHGVRCAALLRLPVSRAHGAQEGHPRAIQHRGRRRWRLVRSLPFFLRSSLS